MFDVDGDEGYTIVAADDVEDDCRASVQTEVITHLAANTQ